MATARRSDSDEDEMRPQDLSSISGGPMQKPSTRPPFDPELELGLAEFVKILPSTLTADMIPVLRVAQAIKVEDVIDGRPVTHREARIRGYQGDEITVSIFARSDHTGSRAGIYHTHGGGMVVGDRFLGMPEVLGWVEAFDAVCVSVEYRLAPEFPDPCPVEDCYSGLVWMADHVDELGVDPSQLIIAGASAGGGLAAGTTLLARDRCGPALLGSLLMCPMIDDRNLTPSSHQIDGVGVWDRCSNEMGWSALLGERRGTDSVSIYASPSRATDLSGLPPTFIDVASAEVFRDEAVAYASRIWAGGGIAELHVVPGGYHGFENVAPDSALGRQVIATRKQWLRRMLAE
jgi:acetyl esterase/lipase